jgi:hypothetical protein
MKMRTAVVRVIPIAAVLVLLGGFAVHRFAPRRVPEGQPPLAEISQVSLPSLREAFNQARGRARVVLLVSPT